MSSIADDARRYREIIRNIGIGGGYFILRYPPDYHFNTATKDYLDEYVDWLIAKAPNRHPACARHCAIYMKHNRPSCNGFCAYQDGADTPTDIARSSEQKEK